MHYLDESTYLLQYSRERRFRHDWGCRLQWTIPGCMNVASFAHPMPIWSRCPDPGMGSASGETDRESYTSDYSIAGDTASHRQEFWKSAKRASFGSYMNVCVESTLLCVCNCSINTAATRHFSAGVSDLAVITYGYVQSSATDPAIPPTVVQWRIIIDEDWAIHLHVGRSNCHPRCLTACPRW
jgi:hypothetical protein